MRINFVLLPSPKITGGPLAILEYAERFRRRGHEVSVTTAPRFLWFGQRPFPWFDFGGRILYDEIEGPVYDVHFKGGLFRNLLRGAAFFVRNFRNTRALAYQANEIRRQLHAKTLHEITRTVARDNGLPGIVELLAAISGNPEAPTPLHSLYSDLALSQFLMNAMPDCDVNIATWWATALPVYFSGKGKPVIFLQHLEEVFYPVEREHVLSRLMSRLALSLPLYKIANSSWLQREIQVRFGQNVPWSNNALAVEDFSPRPKPSAQDGILRVVTYSRPEEWKGLGDAVAAMREVKGRYGDNVQWHVFGYLDPRLPPDNPFAPYRYHPDLSFRELARLYAEADVTLCPSWYESFPLPPLESMASGTAVVTTRYGTEDYAFDGQTALVVKPRDTSAMARAVLRLLDDPYLREQLAKAGRAKAEEYTWDRAVAVREAMLEDIHRGNVQYDLFAPSQTGIVDATSVPFEICPDDLHLPPGLELIRDEHDRVYLIQHGRKRRIVDKALLELPPLRNKDRVELDALSAHRIPTGFPISGPHDL